MQDLATHSAAALTWIQQIPRRFRTLINYRFDPIRAPWQKEAQKTDI
jgi:hypothetical protein